MNSRERLLAILLIVVMASAAGGFGFYQFVWTPIKRDNDDINKLQTEISNLEVEKESTEKAAENFESNTRQKSLPLDVNLARKEYARLLNAMLRRADFNVTEIKVGAREKNTTNVPAVVGKTPAYTRLEFDVTAKGDLSSLVDFLYEFYRQPLLHHITKLTIVKPVGERGRGGDLDITLLVQAIVLDKAQNRGGLLPMSPAPPVTLVAGAAGSMAFTNHSLSLRLGVPLASADVLGRGGSQTAATPLQEYLRIAGKNIFYGPPITSNKKDQSDKEPVEQANREIDLSPFVALIQVSHAPDGSGFAVIYDRYRKDYYEIHQNPSGATRIEKFYFIYREEKNEVVEIKKKVDDDKYDNRFLTFGSEETGNERAFRVKRILESDIIVEPYNAERGKLIKGPATAIFGGAAALALPGTLYSWHIGQVLKSENEGGAPVQLGLKEARNALLRPLNFEGLEPGLPTTTDPMKKDTSTKRPGL